MRHCCECRIELPGDHGWFCTKCRAELVASGEIVEAEAVDPEDVDEIDELEECPLPGKDGA